MAAVRTRNIVDTKVIYQSPSGEAARINWICLTGTNTIWSLKRKSKNIDHIFDTGTTSNFPFATNDETFEIIFSFRCRVTARFVTCFNLWLRHDLWPHNASICDPARFVTKSASICDQRYTMILESKLCRGKLVFVFTLIMYTKWYNMIIYIWIMI